VGDGRLHLNVAGADTPASVDELAAAVSAALGRPVQVTIEYSPTIVQSSIP
jgi:hypothetical protein